jgi:ribosome maturation factor RimP
MYLCPALGTENTRREGSKAPLFIAHNSKPTGMITVDRVSGLVNEKIEGTDMFVVQVSVRPGNAIEVLLERDSGLTAEDCKSVSRHIESMLDRETEDFSLEVSSPGVGKPLLVLRQYYKNVGRTVKVESTDGRKWEAKMAAANEQGIQLTYSVKEEIPGKKGKKLVEKEETLAYSDIKETKVIISFK